MYESPIELMYTPPEITSELIRDSVTNEVEAAIYKAVQDVHIDVDKKELIKALKYDRGQYEKGYGDAKKEVLKYLLSYQYKVSTLKGLYLPQQVISWLTNDISRDILKETMD